MRNSKVKPWIRFITDNEGETGGQAPDGGSETMSGDESADESVTDSGELEDDADDDDTDDDGSGWDQDRAMRKIRKINAENRQLRERAKKAEDDKQKSTSDLTRENADLKARLVRTEVAAELGLPASLAGRLQGTTRDEVVADAEELLKALGPRAPRQQNPKNSFGEGHGKKGGAGPVDYEALVSEALNP